MNDKDLVLRCQIGDVRAFELLVEKYSAKAVRTVYLVTGRQDLAEDIVQEAFIQCYYHIKQLKQGEYFKTWFYRILVRTSYKVVSRTRRSEQVNMDGEPAGSQMGDHNPEYVFETREGYQEINEAVDGLSRPLKEVVVLYYFNDFTIREIASVLNCREGTVKSRLHNARKLLAKSLGHSYQVESINSVINDKECAPDGKTITV